MPSVTSTLFNLSQEAELLLAQATMSEDDGAISRAGQPFAVASLVLERDLEWMVEALC